MNIADWLRKWGLEQYEQAFREHGIDAQVLFSLTADDLRVIGVQSYRDRWRILHAMAETKSVEDGELAYEKIKVLFDYTKFHIGLYTTLGTLIIGIINVRLPGDVRLEFCPILLWVAVFLIGIAGLAGGIVASTLPERRSLADFFVAPTGFWFIRPVSGRTWTRIEHTAFWLALISAALSFITESNGIICAGATAIWNHLV